MIVKSLASWFHLISGIGLMATDTLSARLLILNDLLFEISLLRPSFMDNYEVQGPQLLNLNLENICLEDHKNIFFVKINP